MSSVPVLNADGDVEASCTGSPSSGRTPPRTVAVAGAPFVVGALPGYYSNYQDTYLPYQQVPMLI